MGVKNIVPGWKYKKTVAILSADGKTGLAKQRVVTQMQRGGQRIRKVSEFWQEVTLDIKGAIIGTGKVVMKSGLNTRNYVVTLTHNGANRLDNGFDTLMHMCKVDGVSMEDIQRIMDKWDMLSENDKAQVFNEYRGEANEKTFGSSSFDDRAVMREDGQWYADTLEHIIDGVLEEVAYE